ncbi:EcsC family protein [Acidithiobacillus sp. IBUN Pt1247-S3]|uniref:EcsC family protein n=1 Tax=Acidithiobacillus sp. IBUN Pt1247-S3 TaxID=3166642 RepID=UPI0034E427B0
MAEIRRLMTEEDSAELRAAHDLLENPGLAARLIDRLGVPIEHGLKRLPKQWNREIVHITERALNKAAETALLTLDDAPFRSPSRLWHKAAVAASGGVGGFFGLSALAIELPVSTTIMLRSIIDIARSQGECITTPETKAACLEVFALGSTTRHEDDAAETGYYATRVALSGFVAEVGRASTSGAGVASNGAVLALLRKVAERFGVAVTDKAMAQLVPAIGAIGGATINTIFIAHFQDMATGHFLIRKLERKYGEALVAESYRALSQA